METRAKRRRYQESCVNDTDPITMDPLDKDCFFIESNGFVHGVDPSSLLQYIKKTGKAENPITRAALDEDTLLRLCVKGNSCYGCLMRTVHHIKKQRLAPPSAQEVMMDELHIHVSMVQVEVNALIDILGDVTLDDFSKNRLIPTHFQPLANSIAHLKMAYGTVERTKEALGTVWGFLGDLRTRIEMRGSGHWLHVGDVDYVVELMHTFINYDYNAQVQETPRTELSEEHPTSVTPESG